jgi:hypothetical protein
MDVRRRPTADRDVHDQGRIAAGCLIRCGEETHPIGADHSLGRRCGAYHEHIGVRSLGPIPPGAGISSPGLSAAPLSGRLMPHILSIRFPARDLGVWTASGSPWEPPVERPTDPTTVNWLSSRPHLV